MKAELRLKWDGDPGWPLWQGSFYFCCGTPMKHYEFPDGIPSTLILVVTDRPHKEANRILENGDIQHDGKTFETGFSSWLRTQYKKGARYIHLECEGPYAEYLG